jgi:hypothetical protein
MSRVYTSGDLPVLRGLRDAYRQILHAANVCKAQCNDLGELLAFATIVDDTQTKFDAVGRHLARLERSSGAGRSPAHKGHGCPASAPGAQPPVSAVGPAAKESDAADITTHASPLCAAQMRQGLPVGETSPHTQSQTGETPC